MEDLRPWTRTSEFSNKTKLRSQNGQNESLNRFQNRNLTKLYERTNKYFYPIKKLNMN